jgi:4-hydroxy-tetrahydrodipicolinate reductase
VTTARVPLAVIGDGRMGRSVRQLADGAGFEVVAFLGKADVGARGPSKGQLRGAAVAIEFSVPGAAGPNVLGCAEAGVPVVCGTTGWDAERSNVEDEVRRLGGGLLWSPNFAVGVHVFTRLVERAAADLAAAGGFSAHIVETHHAAKKDAPSGTARLLAERAGKAFGGTVPIASVRTGHVPGTHEMIFDALYEQIRLVHEARDRRVFAAGALAAAAWLNGRRGVFTMDDFLGTNR